MKSRAARGTLRALIRKHQPELRLSASVDLLVHLNILLFLHRLAEESRIKAFEDRSSTIRPKHVSAIVKNVLKKSKG